MSSTSTVYVSSVPMYQTRSSIQHARSARSTRKVGHIIGTTPIFTDGSSRGSRSLDLDRDQRLPIGVRPSGSGSHAAAPSPPRSSVEKSRSRALRRQGSIFNVPITSNPVANESSTSLSSADSQESTYSTGSLPESRGFSSTRKANFPAPLILNVRTDANSDHARLTSSASASPASTPRSSQFALKRSRNTSLASMSTSDSATVPKSSAGFPTPLTPSFRFVAAANPAHRVRRLQKLARTLGENIPHSLVFPTYPSSDGSAPATPVSERPDTTFDTKPDSNPVNISMPNGRGSGYRRASGGSLRSLSTDTSPSISTLKRDPKGPSRWEPPAEWTLGPLHTPRRESVDDEELVEFWNAESYDVIMARLRNLKR